MIRKGEVGDVIDQPRGLALEVRPGLARPPQGQRFGDDPAGADSSGQHDRGIVEPCLARLVLVDVIDRASGGDEGAEIGRLFDRAAARAGRRRPARRPRCARMSTGIVDPQLEPLRIVSNGGFKRALPPPGRSRPGRRAASWRRSRALSSRRGPISSSSRAVGRLISPDGERKARRLRRSAGRRR